MWVKREHQLTVHLVRLQSRHQVLVHLNKRRLGLLVLIQDQLGGDWAELIVYNNYLQTSAVRETTSGQQRNVHVCFVSFISGAASTVKFKGHFRLLCRQYLSHVLHLFPICQPFASLLLLSEGFLGLRTEILIFNDLADLFATFGGALTAVQLVSVLFTALLKNRTNQQVT